MELETSGIRKPCSETVHIAAVGNPQHREYPSKLALKLKDPMTCRMIGIHTWPDMCARMVGQPGEKLTI
jgi:hypothetical protein